MSVAKIAEKNGTTHAARSAGSQPTEGTATTIRLHLTVTLLLCAVFALNAQDTLKNFHPNGSIAGVFVMKNKVRDGLAKFYSPEGVLIKEIPYVSGRAEGVVKTYHPNGMVAESYQISEGRRNGSYESYDSLGVLVTSLNFYNGLIKKIDTPKNPEHTDHDGAENKHELAQVKLTSEETALLTKYRPVIPPGDPAVYTFSDEPAKFLRGEEEFYARLFYPSRAIDEGLEGTVIVRALINTEGRVDSLHVTQKLGLGCDESAAITVQYTDFIPSKIKGRAVNAWVEIPVHFRLPKASN